MKMVKGSMKIKKKKKKKRTPINKQKEMYMIR